MTAPKPRKPMAGLGHYVLAADGRTPILEEDYVAWGQWFETSWAARCVARTHLPGGIGYISTIFLGLDHGFHSPRPVLFETMSFLADAHEDWFGRYCTWDEALAGHTRIVAEALATIEHTAARVAEVLVPALKVEEPKP
jgi:hypothetical protein